jgi:hypothetical protein
MRQRRFGRPSPALVISVLALVMATAGTSVAMTKITSSRQIGKGVINSGDIHDGTIQLRDTSKKLRSALKGRTGPQGPPGTTGAPGAPGTALAYAHIDGPSAGVDESRSFNVADSNVSHGSGTGKFCFKNLPFTPKNAVVSVDLEFQDTGFATVAMGTGGGDCPDGTQVSVLTSRGGSSSAPEDDSFYILFN